MHTIADAFVGKTVQFTNDKGHTHSMVITQEIANTIKQNRARVLVYEAAIQRRDEIRDEIRRIEGVLDREIHMSPPQRKKFEAYLNSLLKREKHTNHRKGIPIERSLEMAKAAVRDFTIQDVDYSGS